MMESSLLCALYMEHRLWKVPVFVQHSNQPFSEDAAIALPIGSEAAH